MDYEGTYRVTLDLTLSRKDYMHPEDWDWAVLLGMVPDHVQLVAVKTPTEWAEVSET